MTRPIQFTPGEYYHLYNRGVDKRTVFLDEKDYRRFTALLYLANGTKNIDFKEYSKDSLGTLLQKDRGEPLVDIGAWCLMPNHFHLLVRERSEGGVSAFMRKLGTAYTMYFNTKYERTGALFAGSFKALWIANDAYLEYLNAYIHLNPVSLLEPAWREEGISDVAAVQNYLEKYGYSSYADYLGKKRPEGAVLTADTEAFPPYFARNKAFSDFIESWFSYADSAPAPHAPPASSQKTRGAKKRDTIAA